MLCLFMSQTHISPHGSYTPLSVTFTLNHAGCSIHSAYHLSMVKSWGE